uniref:Uncharacterized protein n=1 Tax=Arundo donax TaxID=35708 RepID=A0A0A9B411_ARUDO
MEKMKSEIFLWQDEK